MSPASNDRLDGCPVCDADAVRPTTPLAPEVDGYRCERCGHRWSE
jgi:hypothetical protein